MKRLLAAVASAALVALTLASPAEAAARQAPRAPAQPCPLGGYYGGGDEIPPDSGGIYGTLLVATTSATAGADTDRDRFVCWSPSSLADNAGRIPVTRRYGQAEQITRGDVMGPPLAPGVCCDGSRAVDLASNRFHAAGTSQRRGQFDSSRQFRWDRNDVFYVDGTRATMARFESKLTEGDVFTAAYAPLRTHSSVWSFYSHES